MDSRAINRAIGTNLMKYIMLIAVIGILLLYSTGAIPRDGVGGSMVIGLVLLAGTFLLNFVSLLTLLEQDFLLFSVEGDIGFSFLRLTPFFEQNLLVPFQSLGFMLIVAALIWVNKNGLSETIRLFEKAKKRT